MRAVVWSGILAVGLLGGLGAAALAEPWEQYRDSIVFVEAVLETRMAFGGQGDVQEQRVQFPGAVVDAAGLVMISNSNISAARMQELSGFLGNDQFRIEVRPTRFEVRRAEGETLGARLVAADTALDLAFLRVDGEWQGESPVPIPFPSERPTPEVGSRVVQLLRMGGGFGYAARQQSARLGGAIMRPRSAWVIDGQLAGLGLPVFSPSGEVLGALTTLTSRASTDFSDGGFGGIFQPLGLEAGVGPLGIFVIPADRVRASLDQARERMQTLVAAETADAAADPPASEPSP